MDVDLSLPEKEDEDSLLESSCCFVWSDERGLSELDTYMRMYVCRD